MLRRTFSTIRTRKVLDKVVNSVYNAGMELQTDHPGFQDVEYRKNRDKIADLAGKHEYGKCIQDPEYSPQDHHTWSVLYKKLTAMYPNYACKEFNQSFAKLKYDPNQIPSLQPLSDQLESATDFVIRPVAGLLTPRIFLNAMALRVFCSTQYIRHSKQPHYTPEPDVCHELLGHVPMLLDPTFAAFTQRIGEKSLNATDQEIEQLVRIYWHSAEFGLYRENNKLVAYGAGVLSSYGEIEHSMGKHEDKPEYFDWDPVEVGKNDFPIVTYQPVHYVADSLEHVLDSL